MAFSFRRYGRVAGQLVVGAMLGGVLAAGLFALAVRPTSLDRNVALAKQYFARGQDELGAAEIRQAILAHPDDAGRNYRPNRDVELSAATLERGEQQFGRMLADRPAMAQYLVPGDQLWTWAVRKFAGEDSLERVVWDRGNPAPFTGEIVAGEPIGFRLQVFEAEDLPADRRFEQQWASAARELHKLQYVDELETINRRAAAGELSRAKYVLAMQRLEARAIDRTRAFYVEVFLPWLRQHPGYRTDPELWHCFEFAKKPGPREQACRDLRCNHFGTCYDLIDASAACDVWNQPRALSLLDKLTGEGRVLTVHQQASMHAMRGELRLQKNEFRFAVKEYVAAYRLRPDSAQLEFSLNKALKKLGTDDAAVYALGILLEENPDWQLVRRALVHAYTERKELDLALAEATRMIELDPTSAIPRRTRAAVHFERHEFESGAADLQAAIRLNPNDAGHGYMATTTVNLSSDALRHGNEQVARMLRDRPAMAAHVAPGDALWTWAARKFAGDELGESIDWRSDDLDRKASKYASHSTKNISVYVPNHAAEPGVSADQAFSRGWAALVVEFQRGKAIQEFRPSAEILAGTLGQQEFVLEIAVRMNQVVQRAQAFYLQQILPLAVAKNIAVDPGDWSKDVLFGDDMQLALELRPTEFWKKSEASFVAYKLECLDWQREQWKDARGSAQQIASSK